MGYFVVQCNKPCLFCVQSSILLHFYLLSRKVQEKKQQQELTDNTGEPDCVQDILLHQHAEGELAGLVVGLGCPVSCGGHPARAKDDDQSALKN